MVLWRRASIVAAGLLAAGLVVPGPAAGSSAPVFDFDSPYMGHSCPCDGAGGDGTDRSSIEYLRMEAAMGLKWTWEPVHWSVMEPNGPTSPDHDPRGRWAELDRHVRQAHDLGLNVMLQVTVGGNAGGPPEWAGRRVEGRSAPKKFDALIDFVGKLVDRYRPGGSLATEEGWTDGFGVKAWEMDNEPASYLTNWDTIADDYAEFVTKASQRIKSLHPAALVVAPALASGEGDLEWLNHVLDKDTQEASDEYMRNGVAYAAGPHIDVVSFHTYETLDLIFNGPDRVGVESISGDVAAVFEKYESQDGFEYAPKTEYWMTEGGYDFAIGDPPVLGSIGIGRPATGYRANWTIQYFARSFALDLDKALVMDAQLSPSQQTAVRTMTGLLPDPFPMKDVTTDLGYSSDRASVYRVTRDDGSWTYITWAANGTIGNTTVRLPIQGTAATRISRTGRRTSLAVAGGHVTVTLTGGTPFSEPVFVDEG